MEFRGVPCMPHGVPRGTMHASCSSEAPFGFIHLSTRLLPSSDSHVTKFVKLSLRSRQVYDMISKGEYQGESPILSSHRRSLIMASLSPSLRGI